MGIFVHTMMSLDGFVAGPNDDMSWVFRHAGDIPSALVDEVIARTGRCWEAVASSKSAIGRSDPRCAGCAADAGAVRSSSSPTRHPPTRPDPSYTFLSGDARDAVTTALTAVDGRDLLVLGHTLLISASGLGSSMKSSCTWCRSSSGMGPSVLCLDASRLAQDTRRVGIRASREPAIASRQSGRVSTAMPGHSSGVWGSTKQEHPAAVVAAHASGRRLCETRSAGCKTCLDR